MTLQHIPRSLRVIASGYSIGDPGGVKRTAVAAGMPRYAMEYDRGAQQFRISLPLDSGQFAIWNIFYLRAIGKGAIAFEMDLDSGQGVLPHACNIVPGSYTADKVGGGRWVVSFMVEAESTVYEFDADGAAEALELWDALGPDLDNILGRLAQFVLIDTRVLDL